MLTIRMLKIHCTPYQNSVDYGSATQNVLKVSVYELLKLEITEEEEEEDRH